MTIRTTPNGKRRVEVPVPPDVQATLGTKLSQLIEPGEDPVAVTEHLRDAIEFERGIQPLRITIDLLTFRDSRSLAALERQLQATLQGFPGYDVPKISFSKPRT